jgi:hypothetical protein
VGESLAEAIKGSEIFDFIPRSELELHFVL